MYAGVIVRDSNGDPEKYASVENLLAALTPFDQADVTGSWSNDCAMVVQALTWNTQESRHESTPQICSETKRVIAAWVRLDNRKELCSDLGLDDIDTLTDPQIILAAHRHWGAGCVERLEGDFSFVIYDADSRQLFCARDSVGAKPLFYYLDLSLIHI